MILPKRKWIYIKRERKRRNKFKEKRPKEEKKKEKKKEYKPAWLQKKATVQLVSHVEIE